MVILGIDPGLTVSGFAIVSQSNQKTILTSCGFLPLKSAHSVAQRIHTFYDYFTALIIAHNVTVLALERPFLGKNVDSFLKLGYLRGLLHLISSQLSLELHEFFPREVKLAVTGFGGAQKDQVARALTQLFPALSAVKKNDVTDAVAVALCCAWRQR